MAISLGTLVRRLEVFNHGAVVRAVQREIDKPLPVIRTRVKASALAKLPKRGGLAAWAAAAHVTAQVRAAGNTVTCELRIHRTSMFKPSDLRALDRGRVRHPAWGRRHGGDWSIQLVKPRVYSQPVEESPEWRRAVVRGCERATEVITRGR